MLRQSKVGSPHFSAALLPPYLNVVLKVKFYKTISDLVSQFICSDGEIARLKLGSVSLLNIQRVNSRLSTMYQDCLLICILVSTCL